MNTTNHRLPPPRGGYAAATDIRDGVQNARRCHRQTDAGRLFVPAVDDARELLEYFQYFSAIHLSRPREHMK
eukprot:2914172-Prymnesium_polylepis.1